MRNIAAGLAIVVLALGAWAQDNVPKKLGDQVQFGRNVVIDKDQTSGDVVCIACSVTVHGKVNGDIASIGGHADIDGRVSGDIAAVGGGVRLGPGSEIGGDVATIGGQLERDPTAVVHGTVETPMGGHGLGLLLGAWFGASLLGLIPLSIILALLCYVIAGQTRVDNVAATLAAKTGWSFLAGLGVFVAAIVLSSLFRHMHVLSAVLILGLWVAVFLASILGWTGLSAWVGRRLSPASSAIAAIVIGALVISIIEAIPIFGFMVLAVLAFFALGGAILSGYGSAPMWIERRLGPPPANVVTPGS